MNLSELKSKFNERDFLNSDNSEKKEDNHDSEQKIKYLSINDKFWSLLSQNVAGPRERVANVGTIKLFFNSKDNDFLETEAKHGKNILLGGFVPETGIISFNQPPEEFSKDELAEFIIHELVHYVQKEADKYPDMSGINGEPDESSPWEVEADRVSDKLKKYFYEYCEISD